MGFSRHFQRKEPCNPREFTAGVAICAWGAQKSKVCRNVAIRHPSAMPRKTEQGRQLGTISLRSVSPPGMRWWGSLR